ncbi:hemolysin family protein [candidate division KSB1 bacterium]|nr:hemolysin family protein [candidate division KSB1 bacterium]
MSALTFEVMFILFLIIANGVFAMSETAVISSRKERLRQWANEGNDKARTVLELTNDPTRFLSTVQIGITLIGVLAGAYGGATIAEKLAGSVRVIPWLAPYSEAIGLGLVVVAITYLSLIIGELVPKRLALNNPERIAAAVIKPMRLLATAASPVVTFLSHSTNAMLRVLGVKPSTAPPITEDEIKIMLEQGKQAGVFEKAEQDMVERVFHLGDRRVNTLMTRRADIIWLEVDDSREAIGQKAGSGRSRFPVCEGSLDHILGIIKVKDLLAPILAGQSFDLKTLAHQPLYVPESMRAFKVLELFKQTRTHIALVIDEYGSIQGLITLNDILEAIVGDIPSSDAPSAPMIVRREDGSWLIDGALPVEEFKKNFQLAELPNEEMGEYQTLGGFVMMHMERIPSPTEHFEWGGLRFEVMDMDGHRVDKVLVMPSRPTH